MTGSWLELAIIGFIIVGIAFVIFRGGQANPETTGRLHRRLSGLEGEVKTLTSRMSTMEKNAATAADVKRLETLLEQAHQERVIQSDKLADVSEKLAEHSSLTKHTSVQVERLYDHIVSKGMNS